MQPSLNIGIEEEYQTIDPVTRDLRSQIDAEIIERGKTRLKEAVKSEMHQSVVEVGTGVCKDIKQAKAEIANLRREIIRLANDSGLRVAAAGSHPFADWRKQPITPDHRYDVIVEDLRQVARENLIFGLHVHIGVEDRDEAIHIMNTVRYFLPHILALSTNSPFWLGHGHRAQIVSMQGIRQVPADEHSRLLRELGRVRELRNLLIKTNRIDNAKKIWWDIRPHPFFPTLEFRICDVPMRVDETIAIAALIQATVAKLHQAV